MAGAPAGPYHCVATVCRCPEAAQAFASGPVAARGARDSVPQRQKCSGGLAMIIDKRIGKSSIVGAVAALGIFSAWAVGPGCGGSSMTTSPATQVCNDGGVDAAPSAELPLIAEG